MTRRQVGWPLGRPAALGFLPRFLFERRLAAWAYVLLAWPLVALPALALAWLSTKVAPDLAGPDLGAAVPSWLIAIAVVAVSPFLETLLMSGPVLLLNRWRGPVVAVAGSAVLWAVAHSLQAARWGMVIWWPFLLFSIAFLTWRSRGYWTAVGVVFAMHALNNAGPIAAVLLVK